MLNLITSAPSQPALIDPETHMELSYARLHELVNGFDLELQCLRGRLRVVVVLPNGILLALAAVAVTNRYTFIPMAYNATPEQIRKDIQAVNADAVLVLGHDVQKLDLGSDVYIFTIQFQEDLSFTVSRVNSPDAGAYFYASTDGANGSDDDVMILFTSGTSGKKKLVPITMMNLLASAILTISSLGLDSTSRCLNMMPLYHV
jgi:long-subunit acyl-CoA synthetase (AMP-forming)